MARYMACARNMSVAINDKFAILPGERYGDRGLYLYTDAGAFFLSLGRPHTVDGDAQEFLLRTRISSVGDLVLNFRDQRPGSKSNIQPGISYQFTGIPANYPITPAVASLDERARDVLRQRLKKKVAGIKDFIDEKNRYSSPQEARLAFEKDRIIYLQKLESCRIDGDRDLSAVVVEEVQKLKSGFPGATVWEKEIGGRPPPARPEVSLLR